MESKTNAAAVLLAWVEWAVLLAGVGLLAITEVYRPYVGAAVGLVAAAAAVRAGRTRRLAPRTGLEAPLALFLLSAGASAAIAYAPGVAFLQLARALAGAALFYAVVELPPAGRAWAARAFVLAACGLAVYWPLQHDYAAEPVKFAVVTRLGSWLNAHLGPVSLGPLPDPTIHANVAAGVLVLAIPLALALAAGSWRGPFSQSLPAGIFWSLAAALLLAGVLLTGSRGAWMGLTGAALLGLLALVQRRWSGGPRAKAIFWGAIALAGLALAAGLLLAGNLDRLLGMVPGPDGSLRTRLSLWSEGWGLARDYAITGAGLATYEMLHATYAILIHAPYIAHAHNIFLEMWVEQGVVGLAALVWIVGVAAAWGWKGISKFEFQISDGLAAAGLFGLAAALLHGLVDVVFSIERTLPLVGFAAGFVGAGIRDFGDEKPGRGAFFLGFRISTRLVVLLPVVLALGVAVYPPAKGAFLANLGALEQARVELSRYDPAHFDNPTLDQVRQAAPLEGAIRRFNQALQADPRSRTARQRLGMIALSRGEYGAALELLQAAWEAGDRSSVTRLLLGDALVAAGRSAEAAAVIGDLPWGPSRLDGQAWYRYWLNGDRERAVAAWKTVLLLNPEDPTAAQGLEIAGEGR